MAILPTLLVVASALLAAYWFLGRKSNKRALPPGPPQLPLIGNIHQAPTESPWRVYAEWAKTYGPIMGLRFGKDTIIMLSSHEAARDLLDKRSNIYSSRPRLVMGGDNVSKGNRSVLMPYGQQYRNHRRIQGSFVTPTLSARYTRLQDLESKQLMFELLTTDEDDWMEHFHRYAGSLIYALTFGKRIARGDEKEMTDIGQIMENFLYSARVGTWIVDAIPVLNKLPAFLAPWKRLGDEYHEFESSVYLQNLQNGLDREGANWSKQGMAMREAQSMSKTEMAYLVGTMFEAGSDTTTQALQSFVLSALSFPDEYRKAQQEIDKVLSEDEFPNFSHRTRLPYVDAAAKEVLRWRPVSAGGIPHAVTQDDEYMGYYIPKGATVIANHWAVDRDQSVYGADVEDFRPARFMENPDLPYASFGYGRRVCTGQHIAHNSLFIIIARLLWAFDIKHAVAADGARIEVDSLAYTQGFNSGPMPFKAKFVPRSARRRTMIEEAWARQEKDLKVILNEIENATGKTA